MPVSQTFEHGEHLTIGLRTGDNGRQTSRIPTVTVLLAGTGLHVSGPAQHPQGSGISNWLLPPVLEVNRSWLKPEVGGSNKDLTGSTACYSWFQKHFFLKQTQCIC